MRPLFLSRRARWPRVLAPVLTFLVGAAVGLGVLILGGLLA